LDIRCIQSQTQRLRHWFLNNIARSFPRLSHCTGLGLSSLVHEQNPCLKQIRACALSGTSTKDVKYLWRSLAASHFLSHTSFGYIHPWPLHYNTRGERPQPLDQPQSVYHDVVRLLAATYPYCIKKFTRYIHNHRTVFSAHICTLKSSLTVVSSRLAK
jgi:hypothetical protein